MNITVCRDMISCLPAEKTVAQRNGIFL